MHLAVYLNSNTLTDNKILFQKLFEPILYLLLVNNYENNKDIISKYKEVTIFIDNNQKEFFCNNFIHSLGTYIKSTTIDSQFILLDILSKTTVWCETELDMSDIMNYLNDYVIYKSMKQTPFQKKYQINFRFISEEKDIYYINTIQQSIFNNFIALTSKKVNKYHIQCLLQDLTFEVLLRSLPKRNELSRHSMMLR